MPDPRPDYGRAAELPRLGRGGGVRTHTDAVWVLVSLSVATFGAAFFVSDARRPR